MTDFSALKGLTLATIEGMQSGSEEVIFTTTDGQSFRMWHIQDCCETVDLESVVGDVSDLIGHPILVAEEMTNSEEHPPGFNPQWPPESFTWTFYKLATIKGYVDLRWLGTSNGYYSEHVYFAEAAA